MLLGDIEGGAPDVFWCRISPIRTFDEHHRVVLFVDFFDHHWFRIAVAEQPPCDDLKARYVNIFGRWSFFARKNGNDGSDYTKGRNVSCGLVFWVEIVRRCLTELLVIRPIEDKSLLAACSALIENGSVDAVCIDPVAANGADEGYHGSLRSLSGDARLVAVRGWREAGGYTVRRRPRAVQKLKCRMRECAKLGRPEGTVAPTLACAKLVLPYRAAGTWRTPSLRQVLRQVTVQIYVHSTFGLPSLRLSPCLI